MNLHMITSLLSNRLQELLEFTNSCSQHRSSYYIRETSGQWFPCRWPSCPLTGGQPILKWQGTGFVHGSPVLKPTTDIKYTTMYKIRTSCSSNGKESACNAGDQGSIPGSGKSSGEGNGNPLQYSCLENSMDREAWQATVGGVTKSETQLSN